MVAAERLFAQEVPPTRTLATVCLATAHPSKFQEAFREATGHAPVTPPAIAALTGLPTRCLSLPTATADALRALIVATIPPAPSP